MGFLVSMDKKMGFPGIIYVLTADIKHCRPINIHAYVVALV